MAFNKTGYGVETGEKCRRECDNVIVVDLIDQDEVKGRLYRSVTNIYSYSDQSWHPPMAG